MKTTNNYIFFPRKHKIKINFGPMVKTFPPQAPMKEVREGDFDTQILEIICYCTVIYKILNT